MNEMSIDEVLRRLNMTPAELAGKLSWHIKQHGFDKMDEPTQIVAVHDELKARLKKPLRSL